MENPIQMDDLGGFPIFLETSIYFDSFSKFTPEIPHKNLNPGFLFDSTCQGLELVEGCCQS